MISAGARLARRLRRRSARGIVLCYHRVAGPRIDPAALDVPPALFDAHMAAVRAHAVPLALGEFNRTRSEGRLPERAVAVTFDDGYADNLHTALPILARHSVPAAVFVTTSGIGAPAEFWWDALERSCYAAHELPPLLDLSAGGHRFRWQLDASAQGAHTANQMVDSARRPMYAALSAWLRPLPYAVQCDALSQLQAWSGTEADARDSYRTLRVDELQVLARSPLVEIGSHTITHPVLGLLDASGRREECAGSRAALQHWLGAPPDMFAYPFGEGMAANRDAERSVQDAGYAAAFTTDARAAWQWNRATSIPRFAVQAWSADEFARRLDLWFDE